MLVGSNEVYIRAAFDSEAELEQVVLDNEEVLFGAASLYLAKSSLSTLGGKVTIPDGVVINLQSGQWYVVEAERASHGTWEHIAPQIAAQLAALQRAETRERILQAALEMVRSSEDMREIIRDLKIPEIELHTKIAAILTRLPVVAIPIDEIPPDLPEWANSLRNPVKIWVVSKYLQQGGSKILYSLPDETTPTLETSRAHDVSGPLPEVPETAFGGGTLLQQAIKAGIFRVGEELWMEYGPKGHPKQKFTAIVRENGLEVDGRIYSPSYAAVACMRKAGSNRKTENGWRVWMTSSGKTMGDAIEPFVEQTSEGKYGLRMTSPHTP